MHEGDEGHDALVVVSGSVKVTRTSAEGREVVVGVRTSGQMLGELAVIDGRPRSASVWSLEPTELCVVPIETFRELLVQHPEMCMVLLGTVAARLRESTDQVLELGTQDALARVSRRLLELSPITGDPAPTGSVELGISQQELAARCGLSREAVVKALRVLRSVGWIRQEGLRLVLLDEPALRERAGIGA